MKKPVFIFCIVLLISLVTGCSGEKRTVISLNGEWKIEEGSNDVIPDKFTHTVMVPGLVSLAKPAFDQPGPKVKDRRSIIQTDSLREAFWYCRTFTTGDAGSETAILKVSKAMFGTKVFLNGKDLGEHLPCFTAGYFDVKGILKNGENIIIIRVGAARNSVPFSVPDGFDFEKDRYIPGIFDDVSLILAGTPFISSVQAAPVVNKKEVRVQVRIMNRGISRKEIVNFSISEVKSNAAAGGAEKVFSLMPEDNILTVSIPVENCRLWSPEDPFLYNLTVKTKGDEVSTRFGMREFYFDTVAGRPMLNGKPYFLRGTNATLYRFFEDEACGDLPWNEDWVRELHKSFRKFHWNSIRYCIGIPPEKWFNIADEEGILVQNEFPVWYGGKGWNKWPEALKTDELAAEYSEWVKEHWNHPSVIIWDASNETVSNDGRTEEIVEAINKVRTSDLSRRPWDNSYSTIREPGDVMELHPYHFQNARFRLRDLATADINPGGEAGSSRFMKIVNEYGWLWLNRDGSPTTLTSELYKNLLGSRSTLQERRHIYAMYLAAETEFWRCHRQCAGVLHFTALGYSRSDGQTSDHFIDVTKLEYEEEFMKYMPDAFSPVGLMLDEWGNEIVTGLGHDYKVKAINDLGKEWKGKVSVEIFSGEKLVSGTSVDLMVPSFGEAETVVNLMVPEPGMYTVVASLNREDDKPVRSIREINYIKVKQGQKVVSD